MEVINRTLGNMFCCLAGGQPKSWDEYLAQAELAFNSMVNRSTGRTQFGIFYTKEPKLILDLVILPKTKKVANKFVKDFDQILEEVKQKLTASTLQT